MINSIQYLRGFAALAVILFHVHGYSSASFGLDLAPYLFGNAYLGVDLFFVISGFIIAYMAVEKRQSRKDFIVNRVARIAPPYWWLTLLLAVMVWFLPFLFSTVTFDISALLLSLFFASWLADQGTFLYVGWSLEYEILFYAFVLAIYAQFQRVSLSGLLIAATSIAGMSPLIVPLTNLNPLFFLQFIGGILVFLRLRGNVSAREFIFGLSTLALLPLALADYRISAGLLCGVGLLMTALHLEMVRKLTFKNRVLISIGNSSYSSYLLQVFTIPAVAKILAMTSMPGKGWVMLIVAPILTLLIGHLFHLQIELRIFRHARATLARIVGREPVALAADKT